MMFPYRSVIQIEKNSDTPVYLQIANALSREIRNGILKAGTKLPGARSLAETISVNRNTVVAVYEELHLQGYIELLPKRGAFISRRIPEIKPKPIVDGDRRTRFAEMSGYKIKAKSILPVYSTQKKGMLEFNDGLPDERIAPLTDLTRAYRSLFNRCSRLQFGYTEAEGNPKLRDSISKYLNETRGFDCTRENILITRGSQMGIYLAAQLLLQPNDLVVVGETNYPAANQTFEYCGASLQRVKTDQLGIDVDQIEAICRKKTVRAVYVTPHHHYPTTVTLSACRRMKLLSLAEQYRFAIIEDDYDYEFHYKSSPILPLASADNKGMVINIGSLSKNFSPVLRVAYVVAPKNVIAELSKLRSIIDRQGDYLLEQAIAELFDEGVFKRYLRKASNIYHERRDFFCDQLKSKLGKSVQFTVPSGGLATWVEFEKSISLEQVAANAHKKGLLINDGKIFDYKNRYYNATRFGFASLNFKEQENAVNILYDSMRLNK